MPVTTADFRTVFLMVALIPLFSVFGFLRLAATDGAEISGHRIQAGAVMKAGWVSRGSLAFATSGPGTGRSRGRT